VAEARSCNLRLSRVGSDRVLQSRPV
jgi:hypothetical protein